MIVIVFQGIQDLARLSPREARRCDDVGHAQLVVTQNITLDGVIDATAGVDAARVPPVITPRRLSDSGSSPEGVIEWDRQPDFWSLCCADARFRG